jgi:hypothetical protein
LACPFFLPLEVVTDELWPHRRRLPLGDGYAGQCAADAANYAIPTHEELRQCCNLGYATACPRLPAERVADAVRFIARSVENTVQVRYVLERAHAPAETGTLVYDALTGSFLESHADHRIQRMAECHLQSFLRARTQ